MKGNVEQAWANRVKTIRAAIRLRHSIAADNELNAILDDERKKFNKAVMQGVLPEPINARKLVDG